MVGEVASSLMPDATAGPPTPPTSLPSAAKANVLSWSSLPPTPADDGGGG